MSKEQAIILPSPEIYHRDDFPYLCVWRKLWTAVEVGVERGVWSRLFLDRWGIGKQWWGVDDWKPYPEMNYPRDADYQMALANLQPHSHRAKLIRAASVEAARLFAPGSVDFVYLDGAHDYASVDADLRAWWPTISEIGLLSGHDWTDQPHHAGVKRAVMDFAREVGQTIYITTVEGYNAETCPSWYMYKSGMHGPDWRRC
jgi:hypothetical protein